MSTAQSQVCADPKKLLLLLLLLLLVLLLLLLHDYSLFLSASVFGLTDSILNLIAVTEGLDFTWSSQERNCIPAFVLAYSPSYISCSISTVEPPAGPCCCLCQDFCPVVGYAALCCAGLRCVALCCAVLR